MRSDPLGKIGLECLEKPQEQTKGQEWTNWNCVLQDSNTGSRFVGATNSQSGNAGSLNVVARAIPIVQ